MDARNGDLYASPDAARDAGVPLDKIVELRGAEEAVRAVAAKVALVEQLEAKRKPDFDPTRPDCFGGSLNLTDDEVTSLVIGMRLKLNAQGEYDQGDTATLDWDDAYDVATIADTLWHHVLRQRA